MNAATHSVCFVHAILSPPLDEPVLPPDVLELVSVALASEDVFVRLAFVVVGSDEDTEDVGGVVLDAAVELLSCLPPQKFSMHLRLGPHSTSFWHG